MTRLTTAVDPYADAKRRDPTGEHAEPLRQDHDAAWEPFWSRMLDEYASLIGHDTRDIATVEWDDPDETPAEPVHMLPLTDAQMAHYGTHRYQPHRRCTGCQRWTAEIELFEGACQSCLIEADAADWIASLHDFLDDVAELQALDGGIMTREDAA